MPDHALHMLGEGMAEPRSLLSALEPKWQRDEQALKSRDGPDSRTGVPVYSRAVPNIDHMQ